MRPFGIEEALKTQHINQNGKSGGISSSIISGVFVVSLFFFIALKSLKVEEGFPHFQDLLSDTIRVSLQRKIGRRKVTKQNEEA